MRKQLLILTLLALVFFPEIAFNQDVTFRASTKNTVETGEQFRVVFELNAEGSSFTGPDFKGFNVHTGPMMSTSSSIQIINGRMDKTFSQTYTYIVSVKSEGDFTIEPASVSVEGKKYQSNKLSVKAVAATANSRQQQSSGNDEGGNGTISSKDLFLKAIADKKKAVVGEQIIVTYKLYTRFPLSNLSVNKFSSFPGFWTKNLLSDNNEIQQSTQVIDGVEYIVADIRKVAIFPQKTGTLNIEPMELSCVAQLRTSSRRASRDPFESFFNDPFFNRNIQNVEKTLYSDALNIQVESVPFNQRPADFMGAVGQFGFQSSIDRDKIKTGEAINLVYTVTGSGNLELIDLPSPVFPPDFEVYEPKISTDIKTTSAGISGSRKVEYLIIPRIQGAFTIPAVRFVYYDPKRADYITLSSQPYTISVEKGEGDASRDATVTTSQEGIRYIGSDIRHISLKKNTLQKTDNYFFASGWYFALLFLALALFAAGIWYQGKQDKLRNNQSLVKLKQATKVAKKRLSNAQQYLTKKDQNNFYLEMSQALWGYISDKFTIPRAELSFENVQTALEQRQAPPELIEAFISTLNNCEYARFAPGDAGKKMEELYQQGLDVITKAERSIK